MVRIIHLPVKAGNTLEDLLQDYFLGRTSDDPIECHESTECGRVFGLQSWRIASLPYTITINLKRVDVSLACHTTCIQHANEF